MRPVEIGAGNINNGQFGKAGLTVANTTFRTNPKILTALF